VSAASSTIYVPQSSGSEFSMARSIPKILGPVFAPPRRRFLFSGWSDALRATAKIPATVSRLPDLLHAYLQSQLRQVDLCAVSGMDRPPPNCPQTVKGLVFFKIPPAIAISACDVHLKIWVDQTPDRPAARGDPDNMSARPRRRSRISGPPDLAKLFSSRRRPRATVPHPRSTFSPHDSDSAHRRRRTNSFCYRGGPCIVRAKRTHYHVPSTPQPKPTKVPQSQRRPRNPCVIISTGFVDSVTVRHPPIPARHYSGSPSRGHHIIRAVDDSGRADSRQVTVTRSSKIYGCGLRQTVFFLFFFFFFFCFFFFFFFFFLFFFFFFFFFFFLLFFFFFFFFFFFILFFFFFCFFLCFFFFFFFFFFFIFFFLFIFFFFFFFIFFFFCFFLFVLFFFFFACFVSFLYFGFFLFFFFVFFLFCLFLLFFFRFLFFFFDFFFFFFFFVFFLFFFVCLLIFLGGVLFFYCFCIFLLFCFFFLFLFFFFFFGCL